jgi:hypothetical protein
MIAFGEEFDVSHPLGRIVPPDARTSTRSQPILAVRLDVGNRSANQHQLTDLIGTAGQRLDVALRVFRTLCP